MASKYQTKWEPHQKNEDFWKEVLVGRTVVNLTYDDHGIKSFTLDSGEVVSMHMGPENRPTLAIQDDE